MIKLIALYKNPANVDAFEEHYANVHVPLVEKIPGLRKTEWTRMLAAPDGTAPYYMMYEMYFENMAAYQAALQSPENKAAAKDLMTFAGGLVTLLLAESYEDEVRVHDK